MNMSFFNGSRNNTAFQWNFTAIPSSTSFIYEENTFVTIIKNISNVFSCFTRAFEILIITFLTTQYFIKKSNFASTYFAILNIGYIIDVAMISYWIYPFSMLTYVTALVLCEWYTIYFVTFWNIVLCLNRCSALAFYSKYEKIWTRYTMTPIAIIMIFFPFIIDGHNLLSSNCSFQNMFGCFSFRKQYFLNGTIVNAASNILMLIIITASMWYSRKDTTTSISIHAKTEKRLIYQAIFSSFLLFICFALKFGSCLSFDMDIFYGFIYFSNIGYHIHHLVVMFSHFILSPSFKNAFCKFYHLNFLLVKSSKISGVSKPTPLKNISVLQKTI